MQEPLYGVMQAVRLPYNLNTYQIVGATAAVEDQNYLNQVVTKTQVERKQFQTFLRDNNLTFYDSQTNFIWIKVGDTKKVGEYLLSQGYQVNDHLNSEWIRIALGTAEDNVGMRKAILTIMK